LTELTKRINVLRAAQPEGVKPDRAFFDEIKKTLEESRQIKMVDIEVQPRAVKNAGRILGAEIVKPMQNLDNFFEEMIRAHISVQELHTSAMSEVVTSRTRMVNAVSELSRAMMQNLGKLLIFNTPKNIYFIDFLWVQVKQPNHFGISSVV
jgi:hypothetical protein